MTMENPNGCQLCDCDPSGTVTLADGTLAVCNRGLGHVLVLPTVWEEGVRLVDLVS